MHPGSVQQKDLLMSYPSEKLPTKEMSASLIYPDDGFIEELCHVYSQLQVSLLVGQRYVKVGFRLFAELCVSTWSDIQCQMLT